MDLIHIAETATDKIANSMSTGASISTDMYGIAVKVNIIIKICVDANNKQ